MRRVIVIFNSSSGAVRELGATRFIERITTGFQQRGVHALIRSADGPRAMQAARDALSRHCDTVVAAGGDGTVSSVASALAGSEVRMGILPLGTLNHFARDLRVPLVFEECLDLIVQGSGQMIDLAQVNDRLYLNTCLVGTYPEVVAERDSIPTRTRRSKQLALILAIFRVWRRQQALRVHMEVDGHAVTHRTPFVFVGNNIYSMELFNHEQRSHLNAGVLSVLSLHCSGLLSWLRLAWCGLRNCLRNSGEVDCRTAKEVTLWLETPEVQAAVDGELLLMRNPLQYRSCPAALRVICPPSQP